MKIVPPHEIVKALLDIIESAQTELILVSPDASATNISQIAIAINAAANRGIDTILYSSRNDYHKSQIKSLVEATGVRLILVHNLKSCFYLNENHGLITSLNLGESEALSIHVAYLLDNLEDVKKLKSLSVGYNLLNNPVTTQKKPRFSDTLYNAVLDQQLSCDEINCKANGEIELYRLYPIFVRVEQPRNFLTLRSLVSVEKSAYFDLLQGPCLHDDNFSISLEEAKDTNWYRTIGKKSYAIKAIYRYPIDSVILDELTRDEQRIISKLIVQFAINVEWYNRECNKLLRPTNSEEDDDISWIDSI